MGRLELNRLERRGTYFTWEERLILQRLLYKSKIKSPEKLAKILYKSKGKLNEDGVVSLQVILVHIMCTASIVSELNKLERSIGAPQFIKYFKTITYDK